MSKTTEAVPPPPVGLEEFRSYVRELTEREITPNAIEWDRKGVFRREPFDTVAKTGMMGIGVDERYGGIGLTTVHDSILTEEMTRADAGSAVGVAVQMGLVIGFINRFASEEQKLKYLPRLISGEWLGSYCLTEPGAGSDAGSLSTKAVKDGDSWTINGTKQFISNGSLANLLIVMAKTSPEKGSRGITAFLVEREAHKGVEVLKEEDKMGWRASDTASLAFNDVRVPAGNVIGEVDHGFTYALGTLDSGRITLAAMGAGSISRALFEATEYTRQRVQFGHPLSDFQAVRFIIADMATDLAAARQLTYHAAQLKDEGKSFKRQAAEAKLFATRAAVNAAVNAVQVHGGNGYLKGYMVEKLFRDVKVLEIGEGTSQIQKVVISREVIDKGNYI